MSVSPGTSGPVTLARLIRDGLRLWAYCLDCRHNRSLDPAGLGLPLDTPVPTLGERHLRCTRCGGKRIHTRPDWKVWPPSANRD